MRIGICDDNQEDCLTLETLLRELREKDEILCYTDSTALLDAVRGGLFFSCLFLDILMPNLSGMDLIAQIRELSPGGQETQVVFVTDSTEYAVEAFAHRAVHYLVKPVAREAAAEALNRIPPPQRLGVMVRVRAHTRFLYLDEITLCESFAHEISIRLKSGETVVVTQMLERLRQQLGSDFVILSRGLLVHMAYIEQMESKACILKNGRKVLLSRKYSRQIHDVYRNYLFSRLAGRQQWSGPA